MEITEKELEKRLFDTGNNLLSLPSSISELLASLDLVENLLAVVEQSPTESMKEALAPLTKALIAKELLRHSDVDVKVAVASCISEITRITAPDAPYEDDQMKEVFELIVSSFEKLDDKLSRSYTKRISILQTVAKIRSCVVMLDLECDDLIVKMFQLFFRTIRDDHHDIVFSSMETIMTLVVDESEDIPLNLLSTILNVLKKDVQKVRPIAYQLGEEVFVKCASKLKDYLLPAIRSAGASLNDYSKAVTDAYQSKDEAFEPIGGDAPNKSVVDENNSVNANSEKADENNLVDATSEKAVEVATETPEDTPPSEVGPSNSESPKTIMTDVTLQKDNDNTVSENDNSKEADVDTQGEKVESSETVDDSLGSEEPPKCKPEHNTVAANDNSKELDLDTQGERVESSETVGDSVGTEEPPKCKPEHSTAAANDDSKETDLDMQGIKVESSETIDDSVGTEEPLKCKSEQEKLSMQSKTIMTNGTLQKDDDNTVAVDDNSKEADLDTQVEKVEPSEAIPDTVGTEETPKCKPEQENSSRQEGQKSNSTKSSSEPLNLAAPDKKGEDTDKPEQQDGVILIDHKGCEDPVVDTAEADDDEKSSGAPIPSPKTPDNEFAGVTSACPSVSLADEACLKKTEQGEKREDRIQESEKVSDVDSEKESDTKSECDTQVEIEGTGSESNMNSSSDEKASPVSDPAESAPDSAGDTKSEDDNKDEVDGNSAQDLAQEEEEIEVGDSQLAVKKKVGQTKPTPAKSRKKTSAKEEKKPKTVSVPKSTPKVTKYDSDMEESLGPSLKRKRTSGAKESKTKVYDVGLVGATVKVWWPDDKKFYQGIVDSFDSATKKHTIVYDDGDVEILNLKEEKWQLINLSEGRANSDDAPDEFADETPKGKKAKTIRDLEAKRGKSSSSAKKSGASSSKSKSASKSGSKHDTAKIANKPKEESSKKGGKSDLNKSGKSTKVSTSGGKLMDDTPKYAAKSKDDNINTPKGSTKSKLDISKGASKSKGKTPKSVGKSSAGGSGKLKVATPTNQDDSEDELLEPETTPEKPKGKSQSAPKSQKSSMKRKRSAKGW